MIFSVGEAVMLKSGVYPITVVGVDGEELTCQWLNYRGEKFEEVFNKELLFSPVKEKVFNTSMKPAIVNSYEYDDLVRSEGYYYIDFLPQISVNSEDDLTIGSIVRFSSYHIYMTIEDIRDNDAVCIWFNKYGYLKREIFNTNTLVLFDFNQKYSPSGIEESLISS